jgi:hypothetical protein
MTWKDGGCRKAQRQNARAGVNQGRIKEKKGCKKQENPVP